MCPPLLANKLQSFALLSYSATDNVLINLLLAGLSGAQYLKSDNDEKQAVGVLPRLNSPLGLKSGPFSNLSSGSNSLLSLVNKHVFTFMM